MDDIPAAAVELIKRYEGLRLESYRCPAGYLTIGWGHRDNVLPAMHITREMADYYLNRDLRELANLLRPLIDVPLTPNQWAALLSFAFNVGVGAFRDSTLRKRLNAGDYDAVPAELMRWNKATIKGVKRVLPGLIARREAEAELWRRA
jgi:lysozyme